MGTTNNRSGGGHHLFVTAAIAAQFLSTLHGTLTLGTLSTHVLKRNGKRKKKKRYIVEAMQEWQWNFVDTIIQSHIEIV